MSIKKRIKPGKIEPSADGTAIVVHFITELTHLDEDGTPGHVEKIPETREVPIGVAIRGLRLEDIPLLAAEVVERCKYIPASKAKQVEQALAKLHAAQPVEPPRSQAANLEVPAERPRRGRDRDDKQRRGREVEKAARSAGSDRWVPETGTNGSSSAAVGLRPADVLPRANPDCIDDYSEALYEEDMEAKALGAQKLLRLCTEADLLEDIAGHPTLLGVLSRELRENAKRSHELAVAITGIFVCLGHFSQFHPALTRTQCSDATMRVLEYESRRRVLLHKDLKASQGQLAAKGAEASPEDREKLEREERRYRVVVERQDRLLLLCLLLLRDLSEDPRIERDLVGQKLCHHLVPLLSRNSEDLLTSTLSFLLKLSVFAQNKDQLVQSGDALGRLADLTGHQSPEVALLALRVCHNLSFDPRGRAALATQTTLLGKLLTGCQHAQSRKVALKVLYLISMDPSLRGAIATRSPGCVTLALQMVVKCKDSPVPPDAVALSVNLSADQACALLLVDGEHFAKVMVRGIEGGDPLLLKVLRHVASHQAVRPRLLATMRGACGGGPHAWLDKLISLASSSYESPALLVEVVGILSALDCTSGEVPWPDLCETGLLELLHRLLMVGFSEDDVLLECIVLVATLAMDVDSVPLLADSKVPALLPDLLLEKQEDAEIVVQMFFAIKCLLLQEETCEVVLHKTSLPGKILDLLRESVGQATDSRSLAIQYAADEVLDLILAAESQRGGTKWAERIKAFRFESHNREWCQRIRHGDRRRESPSDLSKAPPLLEPPRGGAAVAAAAAMGLRGRSRSPGAQGWSDVGSSEERFRAASRHRGGAESYRPRHR